MTGKGTIATAPSRRLKTLLAVHTLWIVVVLLLVSWWGVLLHSQAERIAELEGKLGAAPAETVSAHLRTRRMILWESLTLVGLMVATGGGVLWLYFRDARRTRELEAFFASITHELKTPLTSIRLQAETLAETQGTEANRRDLIRRLLEDTGRLEAQVERTLELARLEGGGPVFTREVPVSAWLEGALRPWREYQADRLKLSVEAPSGLAVQADPVGLDVILRNLIENSLRHGAREQVRVSIRASREGGAVVLELSDDGPGFDGDVQTLGRLFQKGSQSRGAGIGLYLVTTLMARMGGQAEFGGTKGFSTRLRFREGAANG